ncbi:MAG TPA: cellulose synthase operon protein YhjQ/BcsQ [Edaphobacter sp.]|nr:cellulose synthase operon protein YhjQ/BcsQ [Edaphobacter sp.]
MFDKQQVGTRVDVERLEDVRPNQDVAALFSNLQLNEMHYQPFTRRRLKKTFDEAVEVPNPTPSSPTHGTRIQIGVFSPMGGSGMSTLTVSLGSILCQLGRRVLLVDTSPWQALVFHFGATEARPGKRTFFAPGSSGFEIHILACDECPPKFSDLESFTAVTSVDCVLFDLGGLSGETLNVYLRECDMLLVPLLPDHSAVRLAKTVELFLARLGTAVPRVQFVLNQMDDSPDAMEVQDLLTRSLGEDLFPIAINHQSDVHDAIADGVVLPFYAPEAQATSVCHEIVRWLRIPEMSLQKVDLRWSEG